MRACSVTLTHLESRGLLLEGVSCLMLVCGVVMRLRSGVDSPVVNTGSAGSSWDSCNRGGRRRRRSRLARLAPKAYGEMRAVRVRCRTPLNSILMLRGRVHFNGVHELG